MANADAYVDEAFVTQYALDYGLTWAAGTPARETAIRQATQYLDAVYGRMWIGTRANVAQALDWPRTGGYDPDYYLIENNVLPMALRQATAEAATRAMAGTILSPDLTDPGTISSESVSVGPLERSVTYVGGRSPMTEYTRIASLLRSLLRSGVRLVRA